MKIKVSDIITLEYNYLEGMEFEVLKIKDNDYAGEVIMKVISTTHKDYIPVGEIIDDYGLSILEYATLVKSGDGKVKPYKIIKQTNVSKYIVEVEDFSKSTETWKIEEYQNGVNIGIVFWIVEGVMCDQDPLDILPELEILEEYGEIMIAENGYLGLETKSSLDEIKTKLKEIGFIIK